MSENTQMHFMPWILVTGSPVVNRVRERWENLLTDVSLSEEVYQAFLASHAGFFFPVSTLYREQIVIAKLELANVQVTDFVVGCNNRSAGFQYTFIELKPPHIAPFTKDGNPSAKLTAAVQQIQNWQRWLLENRSIAKKLFPSKHFVMTDDPNFKFMIIMGRRENTEQFLARRNYHSQSLGIEIRSFDYLTDVLNAKRFESFTPISRDLDKTISETENNSFANPFYRAYTDSQWRKIVADPALSLRHMVGHNLPLLLKYRDYNTEAMHEFMRYLDTIPKQDRIIPSWEYDYLKLT